VLQGGNPENEKDWGLLGQ